MISKEKYVQDMRSTLSLGLVLGIMIGIIGCWGIWGRLL